MKEIKREIVTEETIYEITKDELEVIKRKERIKGRDDIINYLAFSLKNFRYRINSLAGIEILIDNIVKFLNKESNIINNTYGYSFNDYINKTEN